MSCSLGVTCWVRGSGRRHRSGRSSDYQTTFLAEYAFRRVPFSRFGPSFIEHTADFIHPCANTPNITISDSCLFYPFYVELSNSVDKIIFLMVLFLYWSSFTFNSSSNDTTHSFWCSFPRCRASLYPSHLQKTRYTLSM